MRAHDNEDAMALADLLTGVKTVICEKHGHIPKNLIAPHHWPRYPSCCLCIAEYFTEKFPVEVVDNE